MTTDTQLIPAVLDEAEAIVEVEWMRLTRDWNQWECEVAEFLAETAAPRPRTPPGHSNTTMARQATGSPPRRTSAKCPAQRSPAPTVRATQRSPPATRSGPTIERHSRAMEVMP
jgi:hypothetical protein